MQKPEVIICTLGTKGDFLPFLAIAKALRRRGYSVVMLANENWQIDAEYEVTQFVSIAPMDESQSGRDDYKFYLRNTLPSFYRSYAAVSERIKRRNGNVVLLYRNNMLGMSCAAEKFGVLSIKIMLQPSAVKSVMRPPWPLTSLSQSRWGRFARPLVRPLLCLLKHSFRRYQSHMNMFRRDIGLKPLRFGLRPLHKEDANLILSPKWFAMPQVDWPDPSYCVGFVFPDTQVPDMDVMHFIGLNGAPIVFTPGTGVTDIGRFFEKAVHICEKLRLPGIFLSTAFAHERVDLRPQVTILRKRYVDLGWLLQHACFVVHHGGIGTTAQALRHGIPQLVVPGRFDQPDNAARVSSLGLGAVVWDPGVSTDSWCFAIRSVMGSREIGKRLAAVSKSISTEDPVSRVCDLVDRLSGAAVGGNRSIALAG